MRDGLRILARISRLGIRSRSPSEALSSLMKLRLNIILGTEGERGISSFVMLLLPGRCIGGQKEGRRIHSKGIRSFPQTPTSNPHLFKNKLPFKQGRIPNIKPHQRDTLDKMSNEPSPPGSRDAQRNPFTPYGITARGTNNRVCIPSRLRTSSADG
jgi:hypothetical protein